MRSDKLHLLSSLNPEVTSCGRPSPGLYITSQRSLFRRRRNAKPDQVCTWCGRVDDSDARRECFQRRDRNREIRKELRRAHRG